MQRNRPTWRQLQRQDRRLQQILKESGAGALAAGLPPASTSDEQPRIVVVDGLIFQLQGNPRGISSTKFLFFIFEIGFHLELECCLGIDVRH